MLQIINHHILWRQMEKVFLSSEIFNKFLINSCAMEFKFQLLNWVKGRLRDKRGLSYTKSSCGERSSFLMYARSIPSTGFENSLWESLFLFTPASILCFLCIQVATKSAFFLPQFSVTIQLFGISHLSSPIFCFVFVYGKQLLGRT